jgi:alkylated DNA repair dioxygenase AlkB
MTGHLDDAEYDQVSPIYSFSFGLSCVFLMGGMNKDLKPLAIRLDSGDLMSILFMLPSYGQKLQKVLSWGAQNYIWYI